MVQGLSGTEGIGEMAEDQNGGTDSRAKLVIIQEEDGSISIAADQCDPINEAPAMAYRALRFLEARQDYMMNLKFEREMKPRVVTPR